MVPIPLTIRSPSGDYVSHRWGVLDSEETFDRAAHRVPMSDHVFQTGTGKPEPVVLRVRLRIHGATMTEAERERDRAFRAATTATQLVWQAQIRDTRGLVSYAEMPVMRGYALQLGFLLVGEGL